MIIDYLVVENFDVAEFENQIGGFLEDGYELYCGLHIKLFPAEDGSESYIEKYYQAMTKRKY